MARSVSLTLLNSYWSTLFANHVLALLQSGQQVDIELVIHYQMLSTPHAKHKAEPAKAATLPEVCQKSEST